jgi:hypothetical protein
MPTIEPVAPSLLTGEPDDLAGSYLQRRQASAAEDALSELRRLAGPQEPTAAPEATTAPAAPASAAEPAPGAESEGILSTAGDVALDIGEGLVELPMQAVGGVRDALQETLDATADFARFLNLPGADEGEPIQLPEVPEGDTTTSAIGRKVTQFVTGFVPAMRATRGLQALGTAGRVTQPLVAGALADAAVFDAHEERLSDLIEEVPELKNPVTAYLAADPTDTEAEGRLKNALEGMALGGIADGFMATVRAVRGVRRANVALDDAPIEEPLARSDAPAFSVRGRATKTPAELSVDEQGVATVPVAGRAANINLGRLETTDDVKQVIADMAAASADEIDVARRGAHSFDLTRQLADEIGMTPEQLLRRRPGQAFSAEEALASRRLLVASGENLIQRARRAAGPNAGPVDLYNFRRAIAQHDAIQQEVAGLTAEAGRALSAFRIPAGAGEQQQRAIRETIELMGGEADQRKAAKLVAAFEHPAQLANYARGASRATTRDMLFEAWINGLLSGPTTHAVNVTSNALVALWQVPERLLAAGIRQLTGGQGVELGEATSQMFGLVQGAKDGLRTAAKVLRTGVPEDQMTKIEALRHRAITGANLKLEQGGIAARAVDFIGELVRVPGRALMTEDTFFKSVGYRMELNARAWRQAVGEGLEGDALARRMQELIASPPRDLEMAATDASLYQTFTAPLGKAGRGLTSFASAPFGRVILPFIRTPVNIMKFVGERTPLAPAMQQVRDDIAAGGARRDLALARISAGSLIMAVSAELSGQGLITGGGPTDPAMRAALRRTGWQPYSIKVGDTYHSFNRLDPLGMTLGLAADITEILGQVEDADAETLGAAGVMAVRNNLVSKTYLNGIADLVEIFASVSPELGANKAEQWLRRMAGTVVPAAAATVERVVDPTLREVDSVVQSIRSRVPGYSDELPPRRNIWGEPIVLQGGLGPDIMSPIYTTEADAGTPIDAEIVEHQVPIRMPARAMEGVDLTQQEYDALVRLAGNELKDPSTGLGARETLDAIVSGNHALSDAYANATGGPDGGKALIIRQTVNAFREMARHQIQQDFPELRAAITAHRAEAAQALTGEAVQ